MRGKNDYCDVKGGGWVTSGKNDCRRVIGGGGDIYGR